MQDVIIDDIGGRLRRAREQRGLSLRDAASRTKLSIAMLEAIERNEFARLPGGMFRKAYVRTLAAEVGLDPDKIAHEYSVYFEPPPEEPAAPQPHLATPLDRYLRPSPSPLRSVVVLAALACGWFVFRPGPVAREVAVADPDVALVMAGIPLGSEAAAPLAIAAAPSAPLLRLEMQINGPCWVAAETDGDRVVYRLMEPGERLVLEAEHAISLRLGNAGAVTLSINGSEERVLGGDGEVVTFELTADDLEHLRDIRT